jgi:RpiB/LacA/LacB family sugar-phosphate isomerase
MRIALGADHAGYVLKDALARFLCQHGHEVLDLGAHHTDAEDDYVDYAVAVARAVSAGGAARGIVICGSGVGASVAANKIARIRAGVCHDVYSAHQGVEHDDLNVLVLGARVIGPALAEELVAAFLGAEFTGEERHLRRLRKVALLEAEWTGANRGEAGPRSTPHSNS